MCRSLKRILPASVLLLSLLLFAAPAIPEQSEDLEILVPESLTSVSPESESLTGKRRTTVAVQSTTGKKITVVGRVKKGAGYEIEVINGFSRISPRMHENYFHTQVTLSLGVNIIEMRWRVVPDGPWKSKSISIFRSSKIEGGVTGNYPPYTFHRPEREEACQECHQMGVTKAETSAGMERSCLKCHKGLADNLFVHGPVNVGICTVCHDPESLPNKYKVQENDDELCYSCHEERQAADTTKLLMHGPVGAKLCTVCHDAHSSPFKFQLVKSPSEICVMCHMEDARRWSNQRSLHPPFKKGDCAGCHDPHSADYKYNLKDERTVMCRLCHTIPVPGHLHEAGFFPRFKLPDDFPLTEDGKTMCLTCHDPHGAAGSGMTRRDGCDSCHNK